MRARHDLRLATCVATVLAFALATRPASAAELVSGLGGPADFGVNRLPPGAHSTCALVAGGSGTPGPIDITPAFPHGFEFFDVGTSTYATVLEICINENGTVTMSPDHLGLGPGTPIAFPQSVPMFAAFWGDVDTSGATLANPDVDAVYWDLRPNTITVTWHNVGYDAAHSDLRNDFQLIIHSSNALCSPYGDVEFRYHRCEWTSGDRSGGVAGHGGVGAEGGFDTADGVHYVSIPGSLGDGIADLCTTSNVGMPGVWSYRIRPSLGFCTGGGMACDTGRAGLCRDGITECHHSDVAECSALLEPTTEVCNGLDDDCDGSTDEGDALCNPDDVCVRGECVAACRDGACPIGQRCGPEGGCIDASCVDVTCAGGSVCSGGECTDPCTSVVCPIEQHCVGGQCVDPCAGVSCGEGACLMGRCLALCACSCPDGYACDAGRCRPAACIGFVCPAGQVCRANLLVDGSPGAQCVGPCEGVMCPRRQHCETGRCVYDPHGPFDAGVTDANVADSNVADSNVADSTIVDATRVDDVLADAPFDAATNPPVSPHACACRAGRDAERPTSARWIAFLVASFALRSRRARRRADGRVPDPVIGP